MFAQHAPDPPYQPYGAGGGGGTLPQTACPACTSFNYAAAVKCAVCETQLPAHDADQDGFGGGFGGVFGGGGDGKDAGQDDDDDDAAAAAAPAAAAYGGGQHQQPDDDDRLLWRFTKAASQGARLPELRSILDEAVARQWASPLNRCSLQHKDDGRTALAYAVASNRDDTVRDLVTLGADVDKRMGEATTALTVAILNERMDGTEMVRLLLSLGSDPDPARLGEAGIEEGDLNITMRYWLHRAREEPPITREEAAMYAKFAPLDRIREAQFSIVGEKAVLATVINHLSARFANPGAQRKPLVMMMMGPPGHGKTYLTRNIAASLVGTDNVLEIACGALRDDADLFGRAGHNPVDGRLTRFLRTRQGQRSVVFLDEFERIRDIVNHLGWEQATKMYNGFLEPWSEGKLTDNSGQQQRQGQQRNPGGNDEDKEGIIDVSKTIFILVCGNHTLFVYEYICMCGVVQVRLYWFT